jgi:hypothetical protein
VKSVVALALAGAVILTLVLWIVRPSAPVEQRRIRFTQKSAPPGAIIDPPFGFHWGDSMAHVESLLGYSSGEIVMRMATGKSETWLVEGLIQPGLKGARFVFEKNALTVVDLQCQYDALDLEHYRARVEDLRGFFENRYGQKPHAEVASAENNGPGATDRLGYSWRLGDTSIAVFCRSQAAPAKRLVVNDLIIRYRGGAIPDSDLAVDAAERWSDTVASSAVARKLQPEGDNPPPESDLGITSAGVLNASDDSQTALVLQLQVKLDDTTLDPTKVVVEVNFYDTLPSGEIVLTDADVNYDWRSQRDWKQSNPENLGVRYIRKAGNPKDDRAVRKFFGYVATVYYDGRLESVRAEPTALINLFPVRTFVSPFENAQTAAGRGDYTTAAKLYRRAADQGNLFALENLAWFYARGKGVKQDYHQAAIFYERAALQNTPRSLNALAWFLATCEDDSICDGAEAVRNATKACELTYWQEWKYIDTLAAAWAESGDFKRAIEFEQQALALKNVDTETRKKIEDRISLYLKRQPVRE